MAYQKLQSRNALAIIKSDTVLIPDPNTIVVLKTATGAVSLQGNFGTVNTLTMSSGQFLSAGINVGAIIYNTTAGEAYYVVSVDSDTQLTISGGGAGGATDVFSIYNKATTGCTLFVGKGGAVRVQMAGMNGNSNARIDGPINYMVDFAAIADASFLPIQIVRVNENKSVALQMVAMW